MSDVVKRAEAAVQEARTDSQTVELVAALLAAQQPAQQHGCSCSHQAPARPRRSAGQVVAVVGAVCACGVVATSMFLAVALAAVSVGVSSLVMYAIYRHLFGGKR